MKRARSQLRGRQAKPIATRTARAYVWYGMPPAQRKKRAVRLTPADAKFVTDYPGPKGKAGRRRRARRRARKLAVSLSK